MHNVNICIFVGGLILENEYKWMSFEVYLTYKNVFWKISLDKIFLNINFSFDRSSKRYICLQDLLKVQFYANCNKNER